jgi:hypothetical protein
MYIIPRVVLVIVVVFALLFVLRVLRGTKR